jgi:hypothetical protein
MTLSQSDYRMNLAQVRPSRLIRICLKQGSARVALGRRDLRRVGTRLECQQQGRVRAEIGQGKRSYFKCGRRNGSRVSVGGPAGVRRDHRPAAIVDREDRVRQRTADAEGAEHRAVGSDQNRARGGAFNNEAAYERLGAADVAAG